ncbi:MAG: hypothetical protein J7M12_06745 [Candidatus Hydrogenedentes bacterium]|nr:hypothetical protein [Candidatus Hydrogenedentota bacterium]
MRNSVRRSRRAVWLVVALVCTGVLVVGDALAQVPVKPQPKEHRVITGHDRFSAGVHNMASSPLDFITTVHDRIDGTRPRYYGLALLTSPIEGLTQSLTRFIAGFTGTITAPVAQGEALLYEYEPGTSALDPCLAKFGRGAFNIVKSPIDIPASIYYRSSDIKPRYYGFAVASSPLEGAAQGVFRTGMGLLEMALAPFPPYDVPFYEYDLGSSVADPAFAKAGFGMYNIASAPLDIPAAVMRRVDGEKPAHSGFAVVASPIEGAAEGIARAAVGSYYLLTWPFPQYPAHPPYKYAFGTSVIDPGLEGFMRGGENIEISPLEIPITGYQAALDRGLIYGAVYGAIMGPTRMVVRIAAGLGEMATFSAPSFEPVYDVGLTDPLPNMARETPRLKRPIQKIIE